MKILLGIIVGAIALLPSAAFAATTFGPTPSADQLMLSSSGGGFLQISYSGREAAMAEINVGETYTYSDSFSGKSGDVLIASKTTSRIYFSGELGTFTLVSAPSGATATFTPEAPEPILGCTDSEANNYDEEATEDDGSCTYDDPEPEPGDDGISAIISSADDGFTDATGVSLNSIVTWMAATILIFIGSGLALLDAMKWWIVALLAIGVIIFFVFKGLRFFNASR